MAKQVISIGSAANDHTGDTLRTAFTKVNANFTELYSSLNADFSSLATVATSGSYNDLTNKPTLFSGSYTDLTNKPTLFSGSYNDLSNKPHNALLDNDNNLLLSNRLYFGTTFQNTDSIYFERSDVNDNTSILTLFVGDDGSGTNLALPSAGATDWFAIRDTNLQTHHLWGSDGSYRLGGPLYPSNYGINFPDGSSQTSSAVVRVDNSAPNPIEGLQWFNTNEGRLYVAYNNQWIDADPQVPQLVSSLDNNENTVQLNSDGTLQLCGPLVFPDSSVLTSANLNPPTQILGLGYNSPNMVLPQAEDTNWAFGGFSDDTNFFMQAKYFGDGSANRGFRIYDSSNGSVPFKVDSTNTTTVIQLNTSKLRFEGAAQSPTYGGVNDRINLYPVDGPSNWSYGIGVEAYYTWLNVGNAGHGVKFYKEGVRQYTFDEQGIKFPDGSTQAGAGTVMVNVPANHAGQAGDKRGMIAAEPSYFYICIADYTGNGAAIWRRIPTDSNWNW